jgi:hypothetical protein
MSWGRCLGVVTVGALVLTRAGSAQQPQPTFRTGINLIEVDAHVFDRSGSFVGGLSKEHFRLSEEGHLKRF